MPAVPGQDDVGLTQNLRMRICRSRPAARDFKGGQIVEIVADENEPFR